MRNAKKRKKNTFKKALSISDYRRKLNFFLVSAFIFGLFMSCFVFDYYSLEDPRMDPDWYAGIEHFDRYVSKGWDWSFSVGDGRISNLENIVYFVPMFFFFLRFIDLVVLIISFEPEREKVFKELDE